MNPDIILLTGGADGGNRGYIIKNAQMLSKIKNIPLVVAGNSSAKEKIEEILKKKTLYTFADNVMPDVNRFMPEDSKEKIRMIFMKKIVYAKGMDEIEIIKNRVLMPTPTAVLKGADLLSLGTKNNKGWGDLIIADIGGATTDIHSVSGPKKEEANMLEGLRESFLKRTVEGDMGMRYSALSAYENYKNGFLEQGLDKEYIIRKCKFRQNNPQILFSNKEEIDFDEVIAKNCIKVSINRHAGSLRQGYINGRQINLQKGKDLRFIKNVIGTGEVIINSKNPRNILNKVIDGEKENLVPQNPNYYYR